MERARKSKETNRKEQEGTERSQEPDVRSLTVTLADGHVLDDIPRAALDIVTYPKQVLRTPSHEVLEKNFKNKDFNKLIGMMVVTMYNRGGIGLAAPQVGIPLRLFVMDTQWVDTDTYKPYVFINPVVVDESNEKHNILEEGCLSVLSIKVPIVRSNEIVLKYKDMQWKDREIVLHGMPAVCGGHEIEHLNGRLIIDHMPYWQKDLYRRRMKRAKKKVKKYLNERI